jgi:hypothetical protein
MRSIRIPADVRHRVSLPRWRALLAAHGVTLGKNATYDDIAEMARSGKLTPRAVECVVRLRALSPFEARDAIFESSADRHIDLSKWPNDDGPLDDAAHLLADHANDEAGIVERALFRVARNAPKRPYRIFRAAASLGVGKYSEANVARFAKLVAEAVRARGGGDYARADVMKDPAAPEMLVVECVRSERTETPFALVSGKSGRAEGRIAYTPLAADVLRLDLRRQRLSIATSARWLVLVYRRAFGEAFFGDAKAFSARASCTLDRILRHGKDALDVPGFDATVRQVRVVRVLWDSGEFDTMRRSGRDVLASMLHAAHHLQGGELVGVTLRFNFVDGEIVDVLLRIPNRVHWSPSRHDATIADWLDAAHFTDAEREPLDLLSLAPHDRPRPVWVGAYGAAIVAEAIKRKYLVKSEARAVAHPEHPDGARDLVVFRTKAGDAWGIPDDADDEVGAMTLAEKQLETFKLDKMAVTTAMVKGAGLAGTPHEIDGRPGLFDAGQLGIAPTSIRPFVAFAEPSARGLAEELRRRALPGHAVLIVPPGRKLAVEMAQVEMQVLEGDYRELPRRMVHAVGLTAFVNVWLAAPVGTRMAIDAAAHEATFDGVKLDLAEQPFLFLTLLANIRGAVLSTKTADTKLGGKTATSPAKFAKYRLLAEIRASFEAAGVPVPADLESLVVAGAGGYRLNVPTFVR